VVWAAWHLPLFFVIRSYRDLGIAMLPGFLFGLACGAIILTWLVNRSGSILMVALWHGSYNLVSGIVAARGMVAALVSVLVMVQAIVLVALDVRARRAGQPSPLGPSPAPAVAPGGSRR
jgi:membrane protease YdiL (CAAX protease family)